MTDRIAPISNERLYGLIYYLTTNHISGFVNYTVLRELLALTLEAQHARESSATSPAPHPAEA